MYDKEITIQDLVNFLESKNPKKKRKGNKKMATFAIKVQVSKPTFGADFSGHDNANFIDREPTEADDGDNHATIKGSEIDPLEMDDAQIMALNEVFKMINRQSVKLTPAGPVGIRISMLPSDGRV